MFGDPIESFYLLKNDSDDNITLFVDIGYNQKGVTKIFLDDKLFEDNKEDSFNIVIGTNNNLIKKPLKIYTSIYAIYQNELRTIVTYRLEGGVHPFNESSDCTVSTQGDVASFIAEIDLV